MGVRANYGAEETISPLHIETFFDKSSKIRMFKWLEIKLLPPGCVLHHNYYNYDVLQEVDDDDDAQNKSLYSALSFWELYVECRRNLFDLILQRACSVFFHLNEIIYLDLYRKTTILLNIV